MYTVKGMKRKSVKSLMFFLPVFIVLLLGGCREEDDDLLKKLEAFETAQYSGEDISEERIEELKDAIDRYSETVSEKVDAAAQLGEYHKMLAIKYMDRSMYGEALKHLQEAISYFPENEVLFHFAGVCSARMAKASVNNAPEEERLLEQAEEYYLHAISLDSRFTEALYGLSVLYIFEMDRVLDAEPYLETILGKEKKNTSAMFLMARVYTYSGRYEKAIEMYDAIIDNAQSKEEARRAEENKQSLLEGSFG